MQPKEVRRRSSIPLWLQFKSNKKRESGVKRKQHKQQRRQKLEGKRKSA